MGCKWRFK